MVSGLVSLSLEICASRLLAPHFGTSTLVWSSIIGVVLLALSTGYFVGGKLAEKKLDEQILLKILVVSGLSILFIPSLAKFVFQGLNGLLTYNLSLLITVGATLSSLVLFSLPVFLLGLVSPYLLTLLTNKYGHLGNTAGQLFALSTLGSLAGTFLPTLLFIPWVGTNKTILGTGLLLLLVVLPGLKIHYKSTVPILAMLLISFSNSSPLINKTHIAEAESIYQHIEINKDDQEQITMRFDAGFGFQSIYQKNKLLTGFYYDYTTLIPALLPATNSKPIKILCIGLAGGTIPRLLHYYYPDSVTLEAVEIDAVATKLAKQYMGLANVPIHIFTQDGRQFLNSTPKQWDTIYVDAYQNELQIPWTLTTQEFWQSLKNRLSSGGIVAMNLAATGQAKSNLVAAITNTTSKIFTFVYDIPLTTGSNANHLILMSQTEIDFKQTQALITKYPELEPYSLYVAKHNTKINFNPNQTVLTDDRAPIEWLMAKDNLE